MNALARTSFAVLLSLGLPLVGCDEDKKVEIDAGELDTGKKPILGGKLGAAVAAAESAQAASPSVKTKDGPPESGIFGPGEAEKALPAATPGKVELLGEGAEPRVMLAFTPPADEQKTTVVMSLRLGAQGGLPGLEYGLAIRVDKPKDKDKADKDKKDDKRPDDGSKLKVVAKVVSAAPSLEIRAQLPKEAIDQIAKMKGSEIRYQVAAGIVTDVVVTMAKDADPGLENAVKGLAEAITLLTTPLPGKPVGKGGYWMVTDHASSFSLDVVRYRVFRVESVDKDRAVLAVETRQYAAKDDVDLGAAARGQKLVMDNFNSQGKGKVEWSAGSFLATQGDTTLRLQARLGPAGAPPGGQRMMMQTEMTAKVVPAEDPKPKK